MDIDWGSDENVPPTPPVPFREVDPPIPSREVDREGSPELPTTTDENDDTGDQRPSRTMASSDEVAEQAEDTHRLGRKRRRNPLKRLRTVDEREKERNFLLEVVEREFQAMLPESGPFGSEQHADDDGGGGGGGLRNFPSLLRSDEAAMQHRGETLPLNILRQAWLRALEAGVGDFKVEETSVFDVEAMASGLSPTRSLPPDPRIKEIDRMIAAIMRPNGTYILTSPEAQVVLPGEQGLDIKARLEKRYTLLSKHRETLFALASDQQYQLRRRKGMAGIAELAQVLATSNALWRRWWHRDFPRQVNEYGTRLWAANHIYVPAYRHESKDAPRPPSWILKQKARQEGTITEAEAGVEAQYTNCAWRRFYAWTQFFERRCYRLIMEIEEARADVYRVEPPRYNPHGVYWQPPIRPQRWVLQPAEDKSTDQPGEGYLAFAQYPDENIADRPIELDRVALLLPETNNPDVEDDTELSPPVLAYLALRHAGDGVDQLSLDGPCNTFASLPLNGDNGVHYIYNFLDYDATGQGNWMLRSHRQRLDHYSNILLSYILWSVVMGELLERKGPPFHYGEALEQVRQRASIYRLPIRLELLEPLEQALMLGLYIPVSEDDTGIEGSWPFLDALPVLPMRGIHRGEGLEGNGGVRFVGEEVKGTGAGEMVTGEKGKSNLIV